MTPHISDPRPNAPRPGAGRTVPRSLGAAPVIRRFGTGELLSEIVARAALPVVVRFIPARGCCPELWITGLRDVPGSARFHVTADEARARYLALVSDLSPAWGPSCAVA